MQSLLASTHCSDSSPPPPLLASTHCSDSPPPPPPWEYPHWEAFSPSSETWTGWKPTQYLQIPHTPKTTIKRRSLTIPSLGLILMCVHQEHCLIVRLLGLWCYKIMSMFERKEDGLKILWYYRESCLFVQPHLWGSLFPIIWPDQLLWQIPQRS